ncbi:alpha/beta fold hydrolase [Hymenobacter cheonanensis]|uniref:alpha/beta fold hydrolase n=1 Tax=Hymenobacter sp. CA2-7 TaxID=3063993 RepID=UPI0027130D99|nr:alpha/beta hydrolase [Hymenobacter sp. CA2-7]MDO7885007.1 alpha/beta hydrolase [Hymenobacter sp. CA2-7]
MTTYLALHYWAGSGREFEPLLPLLPPGTRLLAPDLPGFGNQAAPAGFDYSVASYADWVAQYVEQQQLVDYHIIGHSMSGKVAMLLAARRPAGLRSLLLLSPSPPTPEPMSDADRAASLAAYGQPAEAEKTFNKITRIPLSNAQHAQVVADNLRTTQAAWDAWLLHGSREDISGELATIEVPCRLLVGENDQAISPAVQRQQTLPRLPPGTMMAVVPGAGHLLPLEAPEEVLKGQYLT